MTEREQIEDWKKKYMTLYCERLAAWMSRRACHLRQLQYGTDIRMSEPTVKHNGRMANPRILTCIGCEYHTVPLRRATMADRRIGVESW